MSNPLHGLILLSACAFSLSGCVTSVTVDKARGGHVVMDSKTGKEVKDPKTGKEQRQPARPALYAILPLTVAADVATSPIQFGALVFYIATYSGH